MVCQYIFASPTPPTTAQRKQKQGKPGLVVTLFGFFKVLLPNSSPCASISGSALFTRISKRHQHYNYIINKLFTAMTTSYLPGLVVTCGKMKANQDLTKYLSKIDLMIHKCLMAVGCANGVVQREAKHDNVIIHSVHNTITHHCLLVNVIVLTKQRGIFTDFVFQLQGVLGR